MTRLLMMLLVVMTFLGPVPVLAEAPPAEESEYVTIDEEIQMGKDVAKAVRKKFGGNWNNPEALARVTRIMNKLTRVADRYDTKLREHYSVELLDTPGINAMALPGGTMFVTRGLIELGLTEDELACVMGHEIAHTARRHGALNVEKSRLLNKKIAAKTRRNTLRMLGKVGVFLYLHKKLDPKLEFEADDYGVIYAARAGYDPDGLAKLFERFEKLEKGGKQSRWSKLLSSMLDNHPPTRARIERSQALSDRLKRGETPETTPVPVYE